MLSFAERVKLKQADLVMTYHWREASGDIFAYILCDESGVKNLKQAYADNNLAAPETYGKVLYRDNIHDADEKAKTFLKNWFAENGGEAFE